MLLLTEISNRHLLCIVKLTDVHLTREMLINNAQYLVGAGGL